MDGSTYTDIFTVGDNVMEGWNYYTWDNLIDYQQFRFYRFKGDLPDACRMSEIKFRGVETVANNAEEYSCPVDIYIDKTKSSTFSNTVTYQKTLTPILTKVSPRYGSVTGGETVTFTGTGFSATTSDYTIIIDTIACSVTAASTTSVTCTLGERKGLPEQGLSIFIKNKGNVANQGLIFTYVSKWSE